MSNIANDDELTDEQWDALQAKWIQTFSKELSDSEVEELVGDDVSWDDHNAGYVIDPFFRDYCGDHPAVKELLEWILADGRILSPVEVWEEAGVLIDGHIRSRIHALLTARDPNFPPLPIFRRSFPNRDAAENYLLNKPSTMRVLGPNKRAWRWVLAHADEVAALESDARRNQSAAGGDRSRAEGDTLQAHQPAAHPISVRQQFATAANVSQHIAGAALKLHRWLQKTDHPKIAEFRDAAAAFEKQEFTYRHVNEYLDGKQREIDEDRARNAAIASAPAQPITVPTSAGQQPSATIEASQIVCADWIEGLKRIADNTVALVFTSPPYYLKDYTYNGRNAVDGPYEEYIAWLEAGFRECHRAQVVGGRCIIQIDEVSVKHGPSGKSVTLPIVADVIHMMRRIGYEYLYPIIWYKQSSPGTQGVKWGSFNKAVAPFIRRTHENILVFFKDTPVLRGGNSTMMEAEFKRWTLSQWYCPPESETFKSSSGAEHPCPFPITLAYNAISLLSKLGENDLVIDPFSGTGTTSVAALCLGRRYIGIDREAEFCEIANRRLAEVQAMSAEQRLSWIRSKIFVPASGERIDGWGESKHNGSNFDRRFRKRHPPKPE